MQEAEVICPDETPDLAELTRFDKSRTDKKVSNDEWESPSAPQTQGPRTNSADGHHHTTTTLSATPSDHSRITDDSTRRAGE